MSEEVVDGPEAQSAPEEIQRCCDLVLKGGVTSGVVYPSAVHEIAKKFHLVGIGGTSAGAIAATLAAAAEFRRRREGGSLQSFEELEELAQAFASGDTLRQLFRPDASTRKIYDRLFQLQEKPGKDSGWWSRQWHGVRRGWTGGRLFLGRKGVLKQIRDNGFGLCSGMANDNPGESEPLTQWLAERIDRLAGRDPAKDPPLTFRDLHNAPRPAQLERWIHCDWRRSIDLRCVSTSLTFGRPLEFPLETTIFGFDPEEWRRLFPRRIVDALVTESQGLRSKTFEGSGKLPLPTTGLPVIVAARLSLSFPGLFSAVPLWAKNYHLDEPELERVWCSDGGITSNFPIHRFDALYPAWPTLGINLQYIPEGEAGPGRKSLRDSGESVWLPQRPQDAVLDLWNRFARGESAAADLFGFARSIFKSAKDWHDHAYLRFPGFNDRYAEVWLKPEQGGFNFDMPSAVIDELIGLGRSAGKQLAERFGRPYGGDRDTDRMAWDGHHWARYRSALAGLTETLIQFRNSVGSPMPDAKSLLGLLAEDVEPPRYPFSSGRQRRNARELTELLMAWADEVEERGNPFDDEPPRPPVTIGTRPRF
ncbi:MAG: patatin-like phospholipase family protein [Acidobacteriota bacterium]